MTKVKGWYIPGNEPPTSGRASVVRAVQTLHEDFAVVEWDGQPAVLTGGSYVRQQDAPAANALPVLAFVPSLLPGDLGHRSFQKTYGVRANYVAGAMANGIGSEEVVIAMANAGMMGFFGAAGLPTSRIEQAILKIQTEVGDLPYGVNLIHSPQDSRQEQETVDLLLKYEVRNVSASAFMKLTAPIVQFRVCGLYRDASGEIRSRNHIMAKVSREEVAEPFLRPAPEKFLTLLLKEGRITQEQAQWAAQIPMADDITAEADSGGHTDRQAAPVLLPLLCGLRDRIATELGIAHRVRVGSAGGISTPQAAAAAFSMGADYVLTGSINQACVEAGTSDMVKAMLAEAGMADVDMAPAGDMFEHGAEVQVLKRGTLFAMRGRHLYELYRQYDGIEDIPADILQKLEAQVFRQSIDEVWSACERFFAERDPAQIERAAAQPRHKMALIFRWYLGRSSRWAITGDPARKMDTQIWCGPGIGSFNAWTKGTFLEDPAQRSVAIVAINIMAGAASVARAQHLLQQGVDAGSETQTWIPRTLANPKLSTVTQ